MSARDDLEARVWDILTAAHGERDTDPLIFAGIIEAAETYAQAREPCAACGKPSPPKGQPRNSWACGYCGMCYKRWRRHGSPADGPPPPGPRGGPAARRTARIEDYAELRSWGVPDAQAAARVGVSTRTLKRYKRAMAEAS